MPWKSVSATELYFSTENGLTYMPLIVCRYKLKKENNKTTLKTEYNNVI